MMYYYHNDHLATPQKMTDATGVVVWSADYKPFGEATVNPSSTVTNNLRFPGQYYDVETGLNYNFYRDYNPIVGRYVEADPWNMGSMQARRKKAKKELKAYKMDPRRQHLFVYTGNDPIRTSDPLGLDAFSGASLPDTFPNPFNLPPWNGNLADGYHEQDYICSEPAGVLNKCDTTKNCCIEHDLCYEQYGCNKSSWKTTPFTACGMCNLKVALCVLLSPIANAPDDPYNY